MANPTVLIKTATSVLAASAALLSAFKENPQLADGAKQAIDKIRSTTSSENPKLRFDAKIAAIEACADAVEAQFPLADEVDDWRQTAAALRMRGELVWHANTGRQRRRAMKTLNSETTELLAGINERLAKLTPESVRQAQISES